MCEHLPRRPVIIVNLRYGVRDLRCRDGGRGTAMISAMQALGIPARLRPLGRWRLATRIATVRSLPARLRASEYALVGGSRRFRSGQRQRTRAASRVGFLVIAVSAILDAVLLLDRSPQKGLVLFVLNGAVAVVAMAAWWALERGLRRHPEPTAYAVTLLLTAATAITGVVVPSLAIETVAYLVVLPGLIALILPWRTTTHVRWLLGYAAIALTYFAFGPSTQFRAADRADLIVVGLIAIGASLAGHVLLQRAQIRNFSQLQRIQALHRRADADMAELARVHKVLEETARTDPLTGAGNRVRLAEDLRAARARMNRLGHSQGLLAVDLDRFKLVNDRLGHLAGDDVLKRVVRAISATIRADDAVYRFGGEEFLVLLRVSDADGLAIAAGRIRAAVETLQLEHPENPPHGAVTISIGAVLVAPADLAASDDEWLARADGALYRAKANGRNRVELA